MNKIKYNSDSDIKEAEKLILDGYDIILDFSKKADPKILQRILTYFDDKYGIEVDNRDAELGEILEGAVFRGISGSVPGIIASLYLGSPAGILAGLGALAGSSLGIASAILNVKNYKYRGNTLVKITQ